MRNKYILRNEGIVIVDRGAWASGNDYDVGDLCQNSGSYICKVGHTSAPSTEPGVGANWATVWKALQVVSGTYESQYFKAVDNAPYLRLIDGGNNDVLVRLNAGVLEFYDNSASALRASIHMTTGAMSVNGAMSVDGEMTVSTEKTDHQIIIPVAPGTAIAGTWTASAPSNVLIVTRTAAVGTGQYRMLIPLPVRTSASKGAKLKSVTVCYTVGSADTSADQLLFNIVKQTMPENGSSPVGSILAGDVDADYDANHDTKAERLAAATHTATVTIPSEEQAYASDGEQFYLDVLVTDAATANLTFAIKGAVANFDMAVY